MTSTEHTPRLAVVAAMIDSTSSPAAWLASAERLGSEIRVKAESAAAVEPTAHERALAESLQVDGQTGVRSGSHLIAELLLLADDAPAAPELATALSRAFLTSADSRSAMAREVRRSAFANLYRGLALHDLDNQVRNEAAAFLSKLASPRKAGLRGRGPAE